MVMPSVEMGFKKYDKSIPDINDTLKEEDIEFVNRNLQKNQITKDKKFLNLMEVLTASSNDMGSPTKTRQRIRKSAKCLRAKLKERNF